MRNAILFITACLIFPIISNAQSSGLHQVSVFEIEAPQLDTLKTIWMYLPKSYDTSSRSYPVFYMHDAQNLFDDATSFVGEWHIDEYLDGVTEQEVIIVGIEHGGEKRVDELTPFPHAEHGGGGADKYLDFIINTLKPCIDENYRVLTDASNTAIMGSSLGGLLSFYAVIKHPDVFSKAGVFSPSFWFNPYIYEMVRTAKIDEAAKFYFLVGTEESNTAVSDQNRMVELLESKGVTKDRIKNHIVIGGEHNEPFWEQYFPRAHQWFLED